MGDLICWKLDTTLKLRDTCKLEIYLEYGFKIQRSKAVLFPSTAY